MRRDPLDHLNTAEAAADESGKMRNADLAQERAVHLDSVANGEAGESGTVGPTSCGVDGRGTGRSLAAAEHVRAHHAVAVRVDGLARTYDRIPPAACGILAGMASGHVRVAGERVADEDYVVVFRTFKAAAFPRHVNALKCATVLEAKASGRQRKRRHSWFDDANRLVINSIHIRNASRRLRLRTADGGPCRTTS